MNIELDSLSRSYGSTKALRSVSLQIPSGSLVAVIGLNGAGKSTLLHCLAATAAPTGGAIRFDGELFQRDRVDLRRRLHFLPDFPAVYFNMTPLEHIGMVLHLYGCQTEEKEERILQLLKDLDLMPLASKPLGTLSRGQLYKAALAGMAALNPDLWLIDEPFASGMDPHGLKAFRSLARQATAARKTVVYTTQILEVAERFADQLCVLDQGGLKAVVSADELANERGILEELLEQFREVSP